jgi:hypothetical protein
MCTGRVDVMEPADIAKMIRIKNGKLTMDNTMIIMSKDEFDSNSILTAGQKKVWDKTSLLILKDKLIDKNYLYLEGVVGLARAIMNKKEMYIRYFYKELTGCDLDDEALGTLGDPVAFAIKAILSFKPITPLDSKDFDMRLCKLRMESYLAAA